MQFGKKPPTDWSSRAPAKPAPATVEEQFSVSKNAEEAVLAEVQRLRSMLVALEKNVDAHAMRLAEKLVAVERGQMEQERRQFKKMQDQYYSGLAGLLKQMSLGQKIIYDFSKQKPQYANHPIFNGMLNELDKVFRSMGTAQAFVTEEDMKRAWALVEEQEKQKS